MNSSSGASSTESTWSSRDTWSSVISIAPARGRDGAALSHLQIPKTIGVDYSRPRLWATGTWGSQAAGVRSKTAGVEAATHRVGGASSAGPGAPFGRAVCIPRTRGTRGSHQRIGLLCGAFMP